MNSKNLSISFLLAIFLFLSVPHSFAKGLDFYSRIDDAGDSLSDGLTKRHLQDFGSFRNFGKHCRREFAWLDTAQIDQEVLEDVSVGNFGKLQAIHARSSEAEKPLTSDELEPLRACLAESYADIKSRANREQKSLEIASAIGIFMDGDTKNSDFDIIADIEKINQIIFTKYEKYDGKNNKSLDSINDFLSGKKPKPLGNSSDAQNQNGGGITNQSGNTGGISGNISSSHSGSISGAISDDNIPWLQTCTPTGTGTTEVSNLLTDDFLRDLQLTLNGRDHQQTGGQDYSRGYSHGGHGNQQNGNQDQQNNTSKEQGEKKDFFDKLPCGQIFCIRVGMTMTKHNLLAGGNNYAIERILDKHIKRTEKVSWSDLSGQKMTNNSFQLPFLNIKFADKVAGAGVFMHNTPQVTKRLEEENTPEKQKAEFEALYRCAMISAGLESEEKQNAGVTGAGFAPNIGSTTENHMNLIIPVTPQDPAKFSRNTECQTLAQSQVRNKDVAGFSTQVNEISAFTTAMLDIIHQVLDTERKLDSLPVQ